MNFPGPVEAEDERSGLPVLALGVVTIRGPQGVADSFSILAVDDDGKFAVIPMDQVKVNWRYNWRDHRWDEGVQSGEDEAPDGGPDLPGSIPEPDGVSAGDPFNEEGRSTTGDPGNVDPREEGR